MDVDLAPLWVHEGRIQAFQGSGLRPDQTVHPTDRRGRGVDIVQCDPCGSNQFEGFRLLDLADRGAGSGDSSI